MTATITQTRKIVEYEVKFEAEVPSNRYQDNREKQDAIVAEVKKFIASQYGASWKLYHPIENIVYGPITENWEDGKLTVIVSAKIWIAD